MIVEVCAHSFHSAKQAEAAGADRIELCMELGVGGLTPSYGLLSRVMEEIRLPIHMLVRPRSGDFTYSNSEFEVMMRDIRQGQKLGVSGIVVGILQQDLQIDLERMRIIRESFPELYMTFSRAFDWVPEPRSALIDLEDLGIDCVLSSGQQKTAEAGIDLLKELKASCRSCLLMPGAGINPGNADLFLKSGFGAIHLSAAGNEAVDSIDRSLPLLDMEMLREEHRTETSLTKLKQVMEIVK